MHFLLHRHRMTISSFTAKPYAVRACLLCLVLGSCQRASYVFQPPASFRVPPAEASPPAALPDLRFENARPSVARLARLRWHAPRARWHRLQPRPVSAQPAASLLMPVAKLQPPALRQVGKVAPRPRRAVPGPERHFSKGLAVALAVLLGFFGAHLFYLGDRKLARRYLFITLACLAVGALAVPVTKWAALGSGWGGIILGLTLLGAAAAGIVMVYLWSLLDAARILAGGLEPVDGKF